MRTFNGQTFAKEDMIWAYPQPEKSPYQLEWDDLVEAIREDKPYNEVKRGARGQPGDFDGTHGRSYRTDHPIRSDPQFDHEFAPDVDQLTADGPAPIMPNNEGNYPVPMPGIIKDREY